MQNLKPEKEQWSRNSDSICENFILDLSDYWKNDKLPPVASKMINNGLKMQKNSLTKNNLSLRYRITPRGLLTAKSGFKTWKDILYTNTMEWRTCLIEREIYRNDRKIYKDKEKSILYMTVTNANDSSFLAKEKYSCPNCGAISTVETLANECPYCKTHFNITDLFPKITNFFTLKDFGRNGKEVIGSMLKVMAPLGILASILFSWLNFTTGAMSSLGTSIIAGVVGGGIFGVIVGYIIVSLSMFISLIGGAGKSVGVCMDTAGSRKRFENTVRAYNPEFSFEYFSDKVVGILKTLLLQDNITDSPYYVGNQELSFANVVESSFKGAVALKSLQFQNNYAYVSVDVYMQNYYYVNGKIKRRDEKFRVNIRKNIAIKMNYGFSLTEINCKHCAGSFDASITNKCPYCGNAYFIEDDDWVVAGINP